MLAVRLAFAAGLVGIYGKTSALPLPDGIIGETATPEPRHATELNSSIIGYSLMTNVISSLVFFLSLSLSLSLAALNSTVGLSMLQNASTLRQPFLATVLHFVTQQDEASVRLCPSLCSTKFVPRSYMTLFFLLFLLKKLGSFLVLLWALAATAVHQCARASATIVLNALAALGVPAPIDPTYSPYSYWTQARETGH
jgi:hypothetical protein